MPTIRDLMAREQLRTMSAGGPGSGCHGPNCGRPGGGAEQRKRVDRRMSDTEKQRRRKLGQYFPTNPRGPGGVERRVGERRGTSGELIHAPGGKSRYMSVEEKRRIDDAHLEGDR